MMLIVRRTVPNLNGNSGNDCNHGNNSNKGKEMLTSNNGNEAIVTTGRLIGTVVTIVKMIRSGNICDRSSNTSNDRKVVRE